MAKIVEINYLSMKMNLENYRSWLHVILIADFLILTIVLFVAFCSCNVTRTVQTKAEYYQKGDTTVQVVTRTTESYDGSLKPESMLNVK